ncbi:MAG: NAD-dependent epimerase/dehydratase family protein [bacterium]|nr:MAG: NAD-dependent epimerase/dehydratase family protein [bacterium]
MKILVIGGTGFISGRTAQKLIEKGHHVTIFTRGKSPNLLPKHPALEYIIGDRNDKRKIKATLQHGTFDVVYDFVAYEPGESKLAVKVFQGKVGRFIHCSTISVYMVSNEVQCPITEDQDNRPLMPFWDRNPFGMDYGIKKRQCEDNLWQAHNEQLFPVSMLRPTYVSRPNDPTERDFFWIE